MAQNLVINGETYEHVERLAAKNTDGGVVIYTEGGEGGGVSPTISVEAITGGHRITITDINGMKTVDLMNGSGGDPGKDATINGVNALNITAGDGIDATMDGDTLTIKVKTVEEWECTLEDGSIVTKKVVLV